MAEQPKTAKQKESFFLSKMFMPKELKGSYLAPSDKWILGTAKDLIKTDKDVRSTLLKTAFFGLAAATFVIGGIAGAAFALATPAITTALGLTAAAAPLVAAAFGVTAVIGGITSGLLLQNKIEYMKTDMANRLKPEIGKRYAKMQAGKLKSTAASSLKDSLTKGSKALKGFSLSGALKKVTGGDENNDKKQDVTPKAKPQPNSPK